MLYKTTTDVSTYDRHYQAFWHSERSLFYRRNDHCIPRRSYYSRFKLSVHQIDLKYTWRHMYVSRNEDKFGCTFCP